MSKKIKLINVFSIAILLFTSCTIGGQKYVEPNKPDKDSESAYFPSEIVMRTFTVRYPDAKNIFWHRNGDYSVADFSVYGTPKNTWFNQKGEWLLTKSSLPVREIPNKVTNAFSNNSTFAGMGINETSLLERNNCERVYIINASKENRNINIYYSQHGDLVRMVNNTLGNGDKPLIIPDQIKVFLPKLFANFLIVDLWFDSLGYKVYVMDNGVFKVAALDNNYSWISTFVNLTESTVPPIVLNSFISSKYGKYHVNDFKYMENINEISYLFYFNTENKRKVATLNSSGSFKSVLSYDLLSNINE